MKQTMWVAAIVMALALAGCGGGGGSGNDGNATADAGDLSVSVGSVPHSLRFEWDGGDADHYRLEVNPDGASGFVAVEGAEQIESASYTLDVPVHLTDWVNALYRMVALDASGEELDASASVGLLNSVASDEVVGYFKASNAESDDLFGESVALSADGSRLAVGAQLEGSSAVGVHVGGDDQSEDDAAFSGAVYVY